MLFMCIYNYNRTWLEPWLQIYTNLKKIVNGSLLIPLYIAVLDFGAKGDGTTDNIASFQNTLNAASAGGVGKD